MAMKFPTINDLKGSGATIHVWAPKAGYEITVDIDSSGATIHVLAPPAKDGMQAEVATFTTDRVDSMLSSLRELLHKVVK